MNHLALPLKLTQCCKSTVLQYKTKIKIKIPFWLKISVSLNLFPNFIFCIIPWGDVSTKEVHHLIVKKKKKESC